MVSGLGRDKRQRFRLSVVQHKVRGVRKVSWPFPVPRPNDDSKVEYAAIIRVAAHSSADTLDYAPANRMRKQQSPVCRRLRLRFSLPAHAEFSGEIVPNPEQWKLMQPMHLFSLPFGSCMRCRRKVCKRGSAQMILKPCHGCGSAYVTTSEREDGRLDAEGMYYEQEGDHGLICV